MRSCEPPVRRSSRRRLRSRPASTRAATRSTSAIPTAARWSCSSRPRSEQRSRRGMVTRSTPAATPASYDDLEGSRAQWRNLGLLALAEVLGMSLWFSASAVSPALQDAWGLSVASAAWLTMAVQIGFVVGTCPQRLPQSAGYCQQPAPLRYQRVAGCSGQRRLRFPRHRATVRDCAALPDRLLPGRRLPTRHEAGGHLDAAASRPRHRPRCGRADRRLGGPASRAVAGDDTARSCTLLGAIGLV